MPSSPNKEGPEPFKKGVGWEQAVASAGCLLRALSLLEDHLENEGAKNRLYKLQRWQQDTPKSARGGDKQMFLASRYLY